MSMRCIFCPRQTARPVLYDAQMVNQMIADVDSIDLNSIGTHALHNTNDGGESDLELNAECKAYFKFQNSQFSKFKLSLQLEDGKSMLQCSI